MKLSGRNKTNRAPPIKLCPLFQSHQWKQTGATGRKCSIWVKSGNFLSCVTLKFYKWLWKTKGHLFHATSSCVHHFVAINNFKLELQFGNANFGSKSAIFVSHVTLTFDEWPCKPIGQLSYATSWFVHHFTTIGSFQLKFPSRNTQFGSKLASSSSRKYVTCGLETLTLHQRGNAANNRAPNNSYCHRLGLGCCCGYPWCAAWAGFSVRKLTPAWSLSMWREWKWFFVLTMGIHTFSTGRGMDCDGFRFSRAVPTHS